MPRPLLPPSARRVPVQAQVLPAAQARIAALAQQLNVSVSRAAADLIEAGIEAVDRGKGEGVEHP